MRAQYRLANKLSKQAALTERKAALGIKEKKEDLPLSTEMSEWLERSFDVQASDCTLPETLSSSFVQPLNAMAVYCPTAAISASPFSSTRITNASVGSTVPYLPTGTFYSHRSNWKETFAHTSIIESDNPVTEVFVATGKLSGSSNNNDGNGDLPATADAVVAHNDPINRLNVLWLKRKAQLELEAGDPDAALASLGQAVAAHLGTDDYLKADLRGDVMTSNAAELLDTIDAKYIRYDPGVHVKVIRIQRKYRERIVRKARAITSITRRYRGYLVRRHLWLHRDLLRQSATMIQKLVRNHLWRRNTLAAKLQRWYLLWKQVHLYIRMRERHRAAIVIQRYWRGYFCRCNVTVHAIRNKIMARKIQRLFRSHLARCRRVVGLLQYHELFYMSARVIQCATRMFQARARRRLRHLAAESRETERLARERAYVAALVSEDVLRTCFYLATPAGQKHMAHVAHAIASRDALDGMRARGKIAADEVLRKGALVAFQVLNRCGDGHLTALELRESLTELNIALTAQLAAEVFASLSTALPRSPTDIAPDGTAADVESKRTENITFGEFSSWYTGGGTPTGSDIADQVRVRIRQRLYELEVTGKLLQLRAHREIARSNAELQRLKALTVFRRNAPPRFQCCQCRAAFAVFGTYHRHFPRFGMCATSGRPALFFRKCSLSWTQQRECEDEAIRRLEERVYLENVTAKTWFTELSCMDALSMKWRVSKDVRAFIKLEKKKAMDASGGDQNLTRSERRRRLTKAMLTSIVDLLVAFAGESQLMQLSTAYISSQLNFLEPQNWMERENELVADDVRDWVESMVTPAPWGATAISPVAADDDLNTLKPAWRQEMGYRLLHGHPSVRQRKVAPHRAAHTRVVLLRLLLFTSREVLAASGAFQQLRPRRVSVTDKELVAKSHKDLTLAAHTAFKSAMSQRIEALRAMWRELLAVANARGGNAAAAPQGAYSEGDVMEGLLQNYELEDAYVRAQLSTQQWVSSQLGRKHVTRVAAELWAAKQQLLANDQAAKAARPGSKTKAAKKKLTKGRSKSSASDVDEKPAGATAPPADAQLPQKGTARPRYLFHRFARFAWVPGESTHLHLFGSTAVDTSSTVALMGSASITAPTKVSPGVSLFELQWLANAHGLHIPATKLQEVEKELDPKNTGQIAVDALVQWIGKRETGEFWSAIQAATNGVATLLHVATGTEYTEHARQMLLLAARKRARLALQYAHECSVEAKAGAPKKKDKKSSSSAFDADDHDIFHQGGGTARQLAALACAHELSEVAVARKVAEEGAAGLRGPRLWIWTSKEAAVAVRDARLTVRAADDVAQALGGLTRAAVLSIDRTFALKTASPDAKPEAGPEASAVADPEPVADGDAAAAARVNDDAGNDAGPDADRLDVDDPHAAYDRCFMDPVDHFGILEEQRPSAPKDGDALIEQARGAVASLMAHLFDVTCAGDLGEAEVAALLLFLQCGGGDGQVLRRVPQAARGNMSVQDATAFVEEHLANKVLPEASVRSTVTVVGRIFGVRKPVLARCGKGTAAAAIASLGATEPGKRALAAADRYWLAADRYRAARAASFLGSKAADDRVATQTDLRPQEEERPVDDLLLSHRAQLLAMRQVRLMLAQGGHALKAEKKRVAALWNDQCAAALRRLCVGDANTGNSNSDGDGDGGEVAVLIGFAFDVFAVGRDADDAEAGTAGTGSLLSTELPFLMHYCCAQLRLEATPELGRAFAMVLRLTERADVSTMTKGDVLRLLGPTFQPHGTRRNFFQRLAARLRLPSAATVVHGAAMAALAARARQDAVLACFHFVPSLVTFAA